MTAPEATALRALEPTELDSAPPAGPSGATAAVALVAVTVATALLSALYHPVDWHIAALALATLAGIVFASARPDWARPAWVAVLSLAALTAWTYLSTQWSVAPSRSWIEGNRVALYLVFLLIAMAALRTARARHAAIASVGLLIGALFAVTLAYAGLSDPTSVFVLKRLDAPIGYVNGVAGLAVVGLWPAIALAERLERPLFAAAGAGAGSLLLSVMLLTQSRSVTPAVLGAALFVLAVLPGRSQRLVALTVAALGAAASAPWTLAVFADDRASPFSDPDLAVARAGLLAPLATAAAVVVVWWVVARLAGRSAASGKGLRAVALALTAVAVVGVVVASPTIIRGADRALGDFRAARIDESITSRFGTGGGNRSELWRVALEQWRSAPVVGIGAGGYGVLWYQDRRVNEAIRQPHSLPLQAMAELGIVGLALLLVLAGAVGAAGFLAAKAAQTGADVRVLVGATGSVAAWTVHTSLDWMHNLPTVTGVALIGTAAVLTAVPGRRQRAEAATVLDDADHPGTTAAAEPPAAERGPWPRVGRVAALTGLTVIAASLGVQLAVSAYTRHAQQTLAADPTGASTAARQAVRLDGDAVPAWIALAASEARLGSYLGADAALVQAIGAEPDSYVGYALRGDLATRVGRTDEARAFYGQAADRNPLDAGLAQLAGRTVTP